MSDLSESFSSRRLRFFMNVVVTIVCCFHSGFLVAGCSSVIGQASINEVYRSKNGSNEGLIEIKLINTSIPESTYSTWSIRVCEGGSPSCVTINLTGADSMLSPWLVFDEDDFSTGLIDFKNGFDIVLSDGPDGTGDVIDYLNVGGFSHQSPVCTFSYDTDITNTTNGTKFIQRDPDGSGSWGREQSNSVDPTEGETNGGTTAPIAHWPIEEGSWSGAANEVVDSSGNALHGSAEDDADTDGTASCRYGEFDGSDDLVSVADNSLLDFTSKATISGWIYPRSGGGSGQGIVVGKGNFLDYSYRLRMSAGNTLEFIWCTGRTFFNICSSEQYIRSPSSLTLNRWSHVAVAYQTGSQQLYIDGVEVASTSHANAIDDNNTALYIGGADSPLFGANYEFDGAIDELQLFDQALSNPEILALYAAHSTCSLGSTVDHYAVSFDSGVSNSDADGLTCQPADVSITAHDAGDTPIAPGDAVTIALLADSNEGSWLLPSGQTGTLTNTGLGAANYTFGSTNDSVTLELYHPTSAEVTIDIDTNAELEDPTIHFRDTGFRFVDASDNLMGSVSNPFHQVSATSSDTFFLEALSTDVVSGSCVGAFNSATTVPVDLGAECNNPSSCAGKSLVLSNNGNNHTLVTSDDNGGSASAAYSQDLAIQFNDSSRASLTMNYEDVGAVSLHAKYDIPNADGSDSGEDMLGSSSPVVFAPADFKVTLVEGGGGETNPQTTSTGLKFLPAESLFTLEVEAQNAAGDRTPNFGNEDGVGTGGITDNDEGMIAAVNALVYPSGASAVLGALTNGGAFSATATAGLFENTTLRWNQVGSFTVSVTGADADYLGASYAIGSTSDVIGRFYPAEFRLTSSALTESCGSFSYMEQEALGVSYSVGAYGLQGASLTNYDNSEDDVAKDYVTAPLTMVAENNDDGVDLSSRLNVDWSAARWVLGSYVLNEGGGHGFNDTSVAFDRNGAVLDGPFDTLEVALQVTDGDGAKFDSLDFNAASASCVVDVDCNAHQLTGSLNLRHGRLFLQDVHGPESSVLSVPFRSEYWNTNQWLFNSADNCTQLPNTAIEFDSEAISVNRTVNVDGAGADDTTGSFGIGNVNNPAATVNLAGGDAELFFTVPNVQGSFPIDVDLLAFPWLRFDWDQDLDHADDTRVPSATVTYGSYRGHDRVIYWQERLQ